MTPRFTTTTKAFGYPSVTDYCDRCPEGDFEKAAISRIIVQYEAFINQLTVFYVDSTGPAVARGAPGENMIEIVLKPGEWISRIEGSYLPEVIANLKFISNTGKTWGPFGSLGGTGFVLEPGNEVPSEQASRMGLLYFQGSCDTTYIRRLQATFAEYSNPGIPLPEILKFESQSTDAEPTALSPAILSTFTRQLMSPIITLLIGPDKVELRAYEAILCRLPFFRAALQGHFKEASEKAITMPEDTAETIGALIEFLYTGCYTYAFKPLDLQAHPSDIPVSDVTQGSFHVAVYAVASKYECAALVTGALKCFTQVLKQLSGLDVIALLKVAYGKGLRLSEFEADSDLQAFMRGLPRLVSDAYQTNHDEMESMVAEYPDLGSDLLRLVATAHAVGLAAN